MIRQEGHRLQRLVEDMFTLARADAGQLTVQRAPVYLDEVVADAARAARVLATGKDVDVDLTGQTDLPYVGDESMLRRLVLNLLDNAVRHSPRGGHVEVNVERQPIGYAVLVKDMGSGIPLDVQPFIFTRFYRGDAARTHGAPDRRGAGLGLPIARCIAEAHNGSLELQDSSDRGSTFVVTLPYEHPRV
jgi:two-component system OmpR family sensor kinase